MCLTVSYFPSMVSNAEAAALGRDDDERCRLCSGWGDLEGVLVLGVSPFHTSISIHLQSFRSTWYGDMLAKS